MSQRYLIKGENLTNIANAIREKKETTEPILPRNMAKLIRSISGGSNVDTTLEASFNSDDNILGTLTINRQSYCDIIGNLKNAHVKLYGVFEDNETYLDECKTDSYGQYLFYVNSYNPYPEYKLVFEKIDIFNESSVSINQDNILIARFKKINDTTVFNNQYFVGTGALKFIWENEDPVTYNSYTPKITKTTDDAEHEYSYTVLGNLKEIIEEQDTALVNYTYLYLPDSMDKGEQFLPIVKGTDLKEIRMPKNVGYQLPEGYFNSCSKLENVILPESITVLRKTCFKDCNSLEKIKIPETVRMIETGCFYNNLSLKYVEFLGKSQLTEIKGSVFYNCPGLEGICLPSSVTTIVDDFLGVTPNLKYLELSRHISKIEYNHSWLLDCQNLKYLTYPEDLEKAYTFFFPDGCAIERFVLPKSVSSDMGNSFFTDLPHLKSVKFHSLSCPFTVYDPVLYFDIDMGREYDIYLPQGYDENYDNFFAEYSDRFHIHTFVDQPDSVYVWNVNEITDLDVYLERVADGERFELTYEPDEFCYVVSNIADGDYKLKVDETIDYEAYDRLINIDQDYDNIYLLHLRDKEN